MILLTRSRITNETRRVFAFLPKKIYSMETHPDKNIKVLKIEYVWLEYVGMRVALHSGVYKGVEYFRLEKK